MDRQQYNDLRLFKKAKRRVTLVLILSYFALCIWPGAMYFLLGQPIFTRPDQFTVYYLLAMLIEMVIWMLIFFALSSGKPATRYLVILGILCQLGFVAYLIYSAYLQPNYVLVYGLWAALEMVRNAFLLWLNKWLRRSWYAKIFFDKTITLSKSEQRAQERQARRQLNTNQPQPDDYDQPQNGYNDPYAYNDQGGYNRNGSPNDPYDQPDPNSQNYADPYNNGYANQSGYDQPYDPNYNNGYDPNYNQNYDPNYDQNYDPNYNNGYAQDGYDPYDQSGYAQNLNPYPNNGLYSNGGYTDDRYYSPQYNQPDQFDGYDDYADSSDPYNEYSDQDYYSNMDIQSNYQPNQPMGDEIRVQPKAPLDIEGNSLESAKTRHQQEQENRRQLSSKYPRMALRIAACVFGELILFPAIVHIFQNNFVSIDNTNVFALNLMFTQSILSAALWTPAIFFLYLKQPGSKKALVICSVLQVAGMIFGGWMLWQFYKSETIVYSARVFIYFLILEVLRYGILAFVLKPAFKLPEIHRTNEDPYDEFDPDGNLYNNYAFEITEEDPLEEVDEDEETLGDRIKEGSRLIAKSTRKGLKQITGKSTKKKK